MQTSTISQKILLSLLLLFIVIIAVLSFILIKRTAPAQSITPVTNIKPPKRIGVVQIWSPIDSIYIGLKHGMTSLGYEEGKDVVYEYGTWDSDASKIDSVVKKHIDGNVDLIYAVTPPSVLSAIKQMKAAGKNIPIVYVLVDEPVKGGLAKSFASSGNNTTGVISNFAEAVPKQLEFLLQINPNAKSIGFYGKGFNTTDGAAGGLIQSLTENGPRYGLKVIEYSTETPVKDDKDFYQIADTIKPGDIDAFFHLPAGHFLPNLNDLEVAKANSLHVPSFMPVSEEVDMGGLITYSPDLFAVGEQASVMVYKIFNGVNPSDIPIEYPKKNIIVINLKTARNAGITIPQSLLQIADKTIE